MSNPHHAHFNKINDQGLISDELIIRLCNNPHIQDLAVKAEMAKRQITPMSLTEMSARLQILSEKKQSSSVMEYMRRTIAFVNMFPVNQRPLDMGEVWPSSRARITLFTAMIDVLEQSSTYYQFEESMNAAMSWKDIPLSRIFTIIAQDLMSHVDPIRGNL